MDAVILAGGKGKRLLPLTQTIPKSLVPVAGKPIIVRTLEQLPDAIDRVIIVIGYLGDRISAYLGKSFNGMPISYVTQPEPLGTAHALWQCQDILEEKPFLVVMGDDLYEKNDLARCLEHPLSFGVFEMAKPLPRLGHITTRKDGTFIDIQEPMGEKMASQPQNAHPLFVGAGVYALDGRIFAYDPVPIANGEYGLPQTIARLAKDHPVQTIPLRFWFPIAYPEDLARAEKIFAANP